MEWGGVEIHASPPPQKKTSWVRSECPPAWIWLGFLCVSLLFLQRASKRLQVCRATTKRSQNKSWGGERGRARQATPTGHREDPKTCSRSPGPGPRRGRRGSEFLQRPAGGEGREGGNFSASWDRAGWAAGFRAAARSGSAGERTGAGAARARRLHGRATPRQVPGRGVPGASGPPRRPRAPNQPPSRAPGHPPTSASAPTLARTPAKESERETARPTSQPPARPPAAARPVPAPPPAGAARGATAQAPIGRGGPRGPERAPPPRTTPPTPPPPDGHAPARRPRPLATPTAPLPAGARAGLPACLPA